MNNREENEEIEEKSETLDFTNPAYRFVPEGNHEWRQQGIYLVCKSCELQHAVFIGTDKMMVGQNEKGPILMNRKDYEREYEKKK